MVRELFGSAAKKRSVTPEGKPAKKKGKAPAGQSMTVLGADAQFEGRLKSEGHVHLQGTFKGDISAAGRVIVGENARLGGNLVADMVQVAGVVEGNITARKVTLHRSSRVLGDLRQEALLTEEGSFMQGTVTMEAKIDIPAVIKGDEEAADKVVEKALSEAKEEKKAASTSTAAKK